LHDGVRFENNTSPRKHCFYLSSSRRPQPAKFAAIHCASKSPRQVMDLSFETHENLRQFFDAMGFPRAA
jgi:hypothetical protein